MKMCGRYNFSKDSSSEMVQAVLENLQSRQIEVKTGEVFPGDVAAVIASNRKLEPQAFGMKWGYQLPDGKLIFNARSETQHRKLCLPTVCISADAWFLLILTMSGRRQGRGSRNMKLLLLKLMASSWLASTGSSREDLYSRSSQRIQWSPLLSSITECR